MDELYAAFDLLRGARIFCPPLADDDGRLFGNHGDRLITLGTEAFVSKFDLTTVADAGHADVIMMGGNGGLNEHCAAIPELLHELSTRHANLPLYILPSSVYFPRTNFAHLVGERTAPLYIFVRERYSYEHLRNQHVLPKTVRLGIAPDMAMRLADVAKERWPLRAASPQTLVVERRDVEATNLWRDPTPVVRAAHLRRILPVPVKRQIRRIQDSRRSEAELSLVNGDSSVPQPVLDSFHGKRLCRDVSNQRLYTWEQFIDSICSSTAVLSSRLHVGMLSAMLGIPTILVERGYYKLRGVFEYSLSEYPHAALLSAHSQADLDRATRSFNSEKSG